MQVEVKGIRELGKIELTKHLKEKTMKNLTDYESFKTMKKIKKIFVINNVSMVLENKTSKVGNFEARKDQPHFQGDEYHGHCEFNGYEISWGISGKRRHENKFPAVIPKKAREAVAKVLGIDAQKLECFKIKDENNEIIYLLEINNEDKLKS
jgi:hypothetical protein